MFKYTIQQADQECECSWCGYPMYLGDDAVMGWDDRPYCTKAHALKMQESLARKDKELIHFIMEGAP